MAEYHDCPQCGCEQMYATTAPILCDACKTANKYEPRIAELQAREATLWECLGSVEWSSFYTDNVEGVEGAIKSRDPGELKKALGIEVKT